MHSPIRLSFIYMENVDKARLRVQKCGLVETWGSWPLVGWQLGGRPHCCQRENKSSKAIWQILVSRWRPLAVCQARSRTGPFWEMGTGYTADPLSMPPNSSCESEESAEWSGDSGELDPSERPKQARRSPMQSIRRTLQTRWLAAFRKGMQSSCSSSSIGQ